MNLKAMLVSPKVKLFMGERPIASKKAETSELIPFIDELQEHYGKTELLKVVSVDAGMAHRSNATALKERGIDFIMGLKKNQKTIYNQSKKVLDKIDRKQAKGSLLHEKYNGNDISYYIYRQKVTGSYASMPEIQQVWRIEKETTDIKTGKVTIENRYYMSSLSTTQITPKQCLIATRAHWGIENNGNWTLDCLFGEDDFPLTTRAMQLVSLMRMLAYNCMARFKYRRLRKNENREMSWKQLFEYFQFALIRLRFQQKAEASEIPAFI
jgi:predicted transposase YbfD/YdcC